MADNEKIVLSVAVDASSVNPSLEKVASDAGAMAQKVSAAGKDAGAGIEQIGVSAGKSAQQTKKELQSITSQIQRAQIDIATAGKSASEALQIKADIRGIDIGSLRPQIAALKELEEARRSAAQPIVQASTGDTFVTGIRSQISALKEQIQLQGLSTDEVMRYRAAQAGAGSAAAPLILQLQNMRTAQEGVAAAARAEAAAQKDAAAAVNSRSSFIANLKQQSEAIGKTRADLLEMQAAQMGVGSSAAPFIARLRESEVAVGKVGMSAAATANAMRMVPAQMTDIVVSLQGGQKPLTVLLQQGGQLKDMFGGVGNAAKALGGYVLGLVNPFTIAAGAAAALGYAFYAGSEQQRAFRSALILSGNAVGATAGQIEAAYARVSKSTGQYGASEDAIIGLVKGRQVAVEQLEATAAAVVKFSRAAGVEAKTLVEDFNAIGKDPVKAVLALQEKYGILTAATYQQAAALVEQGKKQEAVNLVMVQAGDAMDAIAKKAKENRGYLEEFWAAAKGFAGGAVQGAINIGKDATPEQNLSKQQALLESLQLRTGTARSWELPGLQTQIEAVKGQILSISTLIEYQGKLAKAQGEANDTNERATAGIVKLNAGYDSHLNKAQQLTKALHDLKIARDDALKGPGVDAVEVNRKYGSEVDNLKRQLAPSFDMASLMHSLYLQESGNRQFRDDGSTVRNATSGATGIAQIVPKFGPDYARMAGVDWSEELLKSSADYGKKLAEAGIKTYLKMFDGDLEKALSAYNAGPGTVKKAVDYAGPDGDWRAAMSKFQSASNFQETQNYRAGILGRMPKDNAGDYSGALGGSPDSAYEKELIKARERLAKTTADADAAQRGLTASQQAFEALQLSPAWRSYNDTQRATITLSENQAEINDRIKQSADEGNKIKAQADAQEAMNAVYGQSKIAAEQWKVAQLGANAAVAEALGQSPQLVAQLQKTAEEQQRYVASLKVAGLKQSNESIDEVLRSAKEQASLYRDELELTGLTVLERAKIVAQRQTELKYAKLIADVDKDEYGDKEGRKLRLNTAKQIESSAAVAKVVQDDWARTSEQINQSLTDALLRGFESGKGFAQNLRDTLVNMFKTLVLRPTISAIMAPVASLATSAVNAATGAGGGGGMMGMASNLSSASGLYGAGSAFVSGFTGYATGSALGGGATLAGSATGLGSLAGGTGGFFSGAGSALAAAGPVGWAALAVLAVAAVVSTIKGDSRFGSQASYTPGGGAKSYGGPNGTADDFGGVSAANKASAMSIDMLLKKVGSLDTLARFGSGFESSEKGKGFSYAGGTLSNGKAFGQGNDGQGYMNNRGSMNAEEAQASYIKELKQATLQALQAASDIPKSIGDKLQGVNIDALADPALDALMLTIQTIVAEVDTFQGAIANLPFANMRDLSFDAAAGLIAAAGGLDKLNAGVGFIFENLYSPAERAKAAAKSLSNEFDKLGVALPTSKIALRQLIVSQDLSTESGRNLAVALGALTPAFVAVSDAAPSMIDSVSAAVNGMSGTLAKTIVDGMKSGDAAGAGRNFADTLIGGVEDALYGNFANQITQLITDQLVNPIITAMATGTSIATVMSGVSVKTMVAQAAAAAKVLTDLLNDPEFKDLLSNIKKAIGDVVGGAVTGTPKGWGGKDIDSSAFFKGNDGGGGSSGDPVADERKRLQDQINALTDTAAQALKRQRDALHATNRALFDQIQLLEKSKAIAEERKGLQDQVNALTDTAAQALTRQRDAIQDVNKALFDQVKAAEKAKAALDERKGLQDQLNALTDTAEQALKRQRDALHEVNRAIFDQIAALNAVKKKQEDAKTATSDALQAVERAINAEKTRIGVIRDAAQESVNTIKGVFDLLKDQVSQLYGTVDSTKKMQASQGNAFIDQALFALKATGYLPDQKALAEAISGARGGLDANNFASQFEADKAALVMAGKLSQMQTTSGYQLSTAEQALKAATDQLTALDKQLELAKTQVDALNGINTSVLSVKDAIAALAAAMAAQKVVSKIPTGGTVPLTPGVTPIYAGMGSDIKTVQDLYTVNLGRMGDTKGMDYWTAKFMGDGVISAAERAEFAAASIDEYKAKYPKFAAGGYHAGGLRIVGENGPELEHTGPSRIYNAADTASMLRGGNNERLEKLVEGLTAEVQRLQSIVAAGNESTKQMADQFDNVTEGGNAIRGVAV